MQTNTTLANIATTLLISLFFPPVYASCNLIMDEEKEGYQTQHIQPNPAIKRNDAIIGEYLLLAPLQPHRNEITNPNITTEEMADILEEDRFAIRRKLSQPELLFFNTILKYTVHKKYYKYMWVNKDFHQEQEAIAKIVQKNYILIQRILPAPITTFARLASN